MNLEEDVRSNTRDIQALTNTVTRLVAMHESAEKRHETDMVTIRDAVKSIQDLNQKMTATIGMQKDIEGMTEKMAECREEIRVLRHDVRSFESVSELVSIVNREVAEARSKITSLERTVGDNARRIEKLTEQMSDVTSNQASAQTEIKALTAWKDKVEAATGAVKGVGKAFWAVFGAGILGVGYFILQKYFQL